jgi:FtsZ-binding cell division protein ZapB
LRRPGNSITLAWLPAVSPYPHPLGIVPFTLQILAKEFSMRNHTLAGLLVVAALSLSLTACKDTKALQESEQLKVQIGELQRQNGQLGNDLDSATADRDGLKKENEQLKAEIKALKSKRSGTKASTRKRRRRSSQSSSQS